MTWRSVDRQQDLDALDRLVCWDDTDVLEIHGGTGPRPHFPSETNRRGLEALDYHVLLSTARPEPSLLELAFVECDEFDPTFVRVGLAGRVTTLMQVEIGHPPHGIRCSRLLYRWLSDSEVGKPRYRSEDARQPDEPQEATSRQVGGLLTGKDVGPADGNAEPQHPILVEPWTYELERIDWRPSPAIAESFLDLTFRRGSERRRLRFLSPTQVKVDQGFCGQSYGLAIHDIRRRGWDGVRIEVVNFESAPGITFYAADVVDLDQSDSVDGTQ
jgi:hypothetical protein